jgi:hypothetical protein
VEETLEEEEDFAEERNDKTMVNLLGTTFDLNSRICEKSI